MYVCVCKAVRERHIREAVRAGVCSLRELSRDLGVGTGCGKCVPYAQEVVAEELLRGAGGIQAAASAASFSGQRA